MKAGFFPMLAVSGMRKNRQLYTPYLLACTGIVCVSYIVAFLGVSPVIRAMRGGTSTTMILQLGKGVMAVFSAIFLFYSHSFLIRRRKREFGLYNILGMGKRSIGRILLWEALMSAALSLLGGLALGVLLSKLCELLLVNLLRGSVTFTFTISVSAIRDTALLFAAIFALMALFDQGQVRLSSPAELMRSESAGEKPPRANYVLGVLGAALLAAAYYLAVSIQQPLEALTWFFVAVIMVIIATYLLFIAGSVVLCRLLQKNKRFYYQARHFVSVASMTYRMKRNGAGLASICILATMVLVTISSTTCLYFGSESLLRARYPRDVNIDLLVDALEKLSDENARAAYACMDKVISDAGLFPERQLLYRAVTGYGPLEDGTVDLHAPADRANSVSRLSQVYQFCFVPLDDYNRITGSAETLAADEVLIHPYRASFKGDTFALLGGASYHVKALLNDFPTNSAAAMNVVGTLFVVADDLQAMLGTLAQQAAENPSLGLNYHYLNAFDCAKADQIDSSELESAILLDGVPTLGRAIKVELLAQEAADYYGMYGGLLFLGVMLSLVFAAAAVLIIYYKQMSEGYEDHPRFAIMRKIGMTQRDIRRSVNAQMLMVFFLPLGFAGLHLGFAFPMLHKLLMLFCLYDLPLLLGTTAITFVVFGLLYALVYRATSNAYYRLVSGIAKDEKAQQ